MKRIVLIIIFCFGVMLHAQSSSFRFASLTSTEIENINDHPDFDFNAEELRDLPVSELLNIYVEEYLDVSKVIGKGKFSTVLSLEINKNGVLEHVSAIGPNQSFNNQAVAVFKKFEGRKMHISQLKETDLEVLIPITIEL